MSNRTTYLIKLDFDTPIYLTDFHRDYDVGGLVYNTGKFYLKSSVVQKAEPSASDFTIEFSAVDQTLVSAFANNSYKNRSCTVTRITMDANEQFVSSETWLDGDMEKYTYTNNEKSSTLKLSVASIFGAFDTITSVNLGHVFSDYINSDVTIHWGQLVGSVSGVDPDGGGGIDTPIYNEN